jgi:HK97 family phage portal protein
MPPYLVGAAPSLDSDWLRNPDPDVYVSWEEFAKQLFWDYQGAGEAYVIATARYSTGWPARFHVVPPYAVNAEMVGGRRRYEIGGDDVTADILHVRYSSRVGFAHGIGPLEMAGPRLVAAAALARYASQMASNGGVPTSVLKHPGRLDADQAAKLQAQWVTARTNALGLPAVLSGGVDFQTIAIDPEKMALVELSQWNEARIAVLLGVPPVMMGLPSGGDAMTYKNMEWIFLYRWRGALGPFAAAVMGALSGWLLPRGTAIDVDETTYLAPTPLEQAQIDQIYIAAGVQSAAQVANQRRFPQLAAAAGDLAGTPSEPIPLYAPPPPSMSVTDPGSAP